WDLVESIGDTALTVGLSFPLVYAKMESGDWSTGLRWSQRTIELADGDPTKGNVLFGSPLAAAYATSGLCGGCLGHHGWRDDQRRGLALVRSADPMSYATVFAWVYNPGITAGMLRPDDAAIGEIEDALRIAERSGDDLAFALAGVTLGDALVHRTSAADRDRGEKLLKEFSGIFVRRGHSLAELPIVNVYLAREIARRGGGDEAIPLMRAAVEELVRAGQLLAWGVLAVGLLVETLLDRGTDDDVIEAEAAIERLAAAPTDGPLAMRAIWLLRMHTLLARARGDRTAYLDSLQRYRDMAKSHEFEGHIDWASALQTPGH